VFKYTLHRYNNETYDVDADDITFGTTHIRFSIDGKVNFAIAASEVREVTVTSISPAVNESFEGLQQTISSKPPSLSPFKGLG
jgi:hypothetical protein